MGDVPKREAFLAQLSSDTAALVAQLRPADLSADVPTCPGWDVRRLVRHLGRVHRWAAAIVRTGEEAEAGRPPDGDDRTLLGWFEEGAHELVGTLTGADPDAPCWTFGPDPQLTGFWIRRQAHETAVHRWDVGAALGAPEPIPDWLAEDGVDEVCRMMFPRQVRLGRQPALTDSVALVSAASGRTWTLADDGTRVGTVEADATVTAPPSTLELLLWHRADPGDPDVTVSGDVEAARRVLGAALTP